jgi:cyclopropane fatty-acyl-phospholipid synthase-like methyltransferase
MDNYNITFQTWDKLAAKYQDKFMNLDLYNDTYDRFCELVKTAAIVLEIGCGPGNITRYVLAKRPDLKILGTDVAPSMLKLAKENNPGADFKVMDCRHIDTLTTTYDAVLCGFCLPYLSKEDCHKFIKDCAALLTTGGILYFSAIEDDYSKSGMETSSDGGHSMFVYSHEAAYLQQWLGDYGFEDIEVIRKQYPKSDGTVSVHIIFIAKFEG